MTLYNVTAKDALQAGTWIHFHPSKDISEYPENVKHVYEDTHRFLVISVSWKNQSYLIDLNCNVEDFCPQ